MLSLIRINHSKTLLVHIKKGKHLKVFTFTKGSMKPPEVVFTKFYKEAPVTGKDLLTGAVYPG